MSLVSQEALTRIKTMRDNARNASSYETSYQWAARAAEAAIAVLEQINTDTADYKIVLEKK